MSSIFIQTFTDRTIKFTYAFIAAVSTIECAMYIVGFIVTITISNEVRVFTI